MVNLQEQLQGQLTLEQFGVMNRIPVAELANKVFTQIEIYDFGENNRIGFMQLVRKLHLNNKHKLCRAIKLLKDQGRIWYDANGKYKVVSTIANNSN